MDRSGTQHYTQELYFLIAKFLEAGPCKNAAEALKKEIKQHKIIPKRLDWEGEEHEQSFEELENRYPHISPHHLLEICKRIGPIIDKEIPPCAPGVKTLLGAGKQSLLRNRDESKRHLHLTEFFARRHGSSIYSPITCHNHNIVQVLFGQEISGPASRRHLVSPKFYSRTHLLNRTLGHLTAVYCLLFDQTGKYIITGADDLLVKVWSAVDGRLLCTLRGASAEITDIAVNIENTLLAAGSLDKILRVWCLQTSHPVATLTAHTGMITGVNFCPNPFNNLHYLVSTSTDGSVAFWSFTVNPGEAPHFLSKPVLYHEKIRPGQAQMICSSYSQGGVFLAAGSADHHVRVYSMSTLPPQRILELERHTDRVDSILWANRSLKFISGSKDGTAVIWRYRAQAWQTNQLTMYTTLPGSKKEEDCKLKLKVTMVCWSGDDSLAITAVNNDIIKIWSSEGKLMRELNAHKDVVYCLENHPLDHRILLSAGHDGLVLLWDIRTGEQLFSYQNQIEGQGHGAIFDAKWSPDGTMMAATDSHGHLLIFGIAGYNDKMKLLPKELFFHSDYRPLMRGPLNQVIDDQMQLPPHLMPPPFLVDMDGTPYPPNIQRLVPGRENCTIEQLTPVTLVSTGGQTEVIQGAPDSYELNFIENLGYATPDDLSILRREGMNQLAEIFSWKKKTLVPQLPSGSLNKIRADLKFVGDLEIREFQIESKREPEVEIMPASFLKKPKKKLLHNYRTRAARDAPVENSREDEEDESGGNSSYVTVLSSTSSTEASSSEYSDWVAEHSVNLEPPQRSRRQRKKKPPPPSPPSPPPDDDLPSTSSAPPKPRSLPSTSKAASIPETITEIPDVYRPSEWLSEVIPKKFPYYPQMGDECVFFTQGYELYVKAVADRNLYQLAKSQLRPWASLQLKEPELVKVIGIKYELRPPRLCCLRLAVMSQNGRLTGERFTIKYHDIPDVIDFFVLKQTYDTAMARNWKIGDRFRSMIDDGWWWGCIEGRRPHADSAFLCHRIRWDNGETEDMSPWDMEPIDPAREPDMGGSVPVLAEEFAAILYHPREDEWPGRDRDTSCRHIIAGLEEVMGLSIAEPFIAPVDINVYKSYAFIVEYPIDLSTIKARFENRFYRRLTAAQFDIRYLATNAEKFNEAHSVIVKNARVITDLCLRICKEEVYIDVPALYRQLMESYESSNSDEETGGPSTSKRERAAANRSLRAYRRANHQQPDWQRDCRQLLEVLWCCQDSEPFRGPVDRLEHPNYDKIIDTPMDLGTIREELKGGNYTSPLEFCKDVRMIFSNSRSYNTNKRSKIYVMTVRLAAMAEEHMKRIIRDWKASNRKQNGPTRRKARLPSSVMNEEDEVSDADSIKSTTSSNSRKDVPQSPVARRSVRKVQSQEENSQSIDENSLSTSDKVNGIAGPSQPRPLRINVSFSDINGSASSSAVDSYVSRNQGASRTRSSNVSRRTGNNFYPDQRAVRPLRLRLQPLERFRLGSTSGTDEPSSSSGHRSRRVRKEVSYVEDCDNSLSSQEERLAPRGPLRYIVRDCNLDSSSESSQDETESQNGPDYNTGQKYIRRFTAVSAPEESQQNNSSTDNDLVPVQEEETIEEPNNLVELEVEVNGVENYGNSYGYKANPAYHRRSSSESCDSSKSEDDDKSEPDKNDKDFDIVDEEGSDDDLPTPSTSRKRKKSSTDSSDCYRPSRNKTKPMRKSQRSRRPLKKQNYTYESDSEPEEESERPSRMRTPRKRYQESDESSDDTSNDKPKISISSRGRIRKITPRARAFLLD